MKIMVFKTKQGQRSAAETPEIHFAYRVLMDLFCDRHQYKRMDSFKKELVLCPIVQFIEAGRMNAAGF